MTTWDDYKLTCVHGVREELDYHDCDKCRDRAIEEGKEYSFPTKTYLYQTEK